MKLPNKITLGRLLAAVTALVLIALHPRVPRGTWGWTWVAFGLVLFAAASDYLDGYVARATGQVSKVGRILDPLVDKVLICGALILLLSLEGLRELLPAWIVAVIVLREVLVTSLRGMVESTGTGFGADRLGKWKMGVQCVAVCGLLAFQGGWDWTREITLAAVWASLVLTVFSGANYLRKALHVLEL